MQDRPVHDGKILIIDDEIQVVEVLSRILEAHGYRHIKGLTDPHAALNLFRSFQPDLVILDLIMPGRSGLQVLRDLRAEIPPESVLPILMVTADPSIEAPREALAAGASDFVTKPYDPSAIVLRVRNLLATRFLYLELQKQNEQLEARVEERTQGLASAQEHWARSFDAVSDHLAILDLTGKIVRANKTMRDRFEPIHGNLIGLDYRVCYCGTAEPETQPPCAAVLAGSGPVSFEGPLTALNGWFAVSSYPIFDGAGRQSGAISVVRDITDRKRAEDALHESKERFRLIFDKSAIGMALTTPRGVYLQVNAAFCALLGRTEEEIIGHASPEFTYPGDFEKTMKPPTVLREDGVHLVDLEKRYLRKDGAIVWAHLTAVLAYDEKAEPLYYIAMVEDISARKQAEDALRATEERFRTMFQKTPVGMGIVSPDMRWLQVNPALCDFLGYSEAELTGRFIADFTHPDDIEKSAIAGRAAHAPGPHVYHLEKRLIRKDGAVVWGEVSAVLHFDESGEPLHFLGVVQDITERKRVAEALRETNDELESRVCDRTAQLTAANQHLQLEINERRRTQEALRISEARFHRIAANAPGMVYQFLLRTDGSMSFPYVSEGARALFGMEPSEIEADANVLISRIHPDEMANFTRSVEESALTLGDWQWEGRFVLSPGEEKWIQGASRPGRQPNGDILWDGLLMDITARRKAGQAARFQAHLLDSIGEAVIATDPAGKILYVNRCTETMYGWSRAEMLGRHVAEIVPAQSNPEQAAEFMEKLRKGETWTGEFPVRRHDGTSFEVQVTDTPLHGEQGEVIAIIGISRDITERKRAEAALRESEARFQQMANSITDVFWMASVDGNEIVYMSPAYEKVWGRPREELHENPRQWAESIHPDDRPRVVAAYQKLALKGSYEEEYRVVRPDGSLRWVKDRGFPVCDANGRVYRIAGLAEDITERKRAQTELNRFFTLSVDLLGTSGFDGHFEQLNPAWEKTLGWTIEELFSRPSIEFIHPEDRKKTLEEKKRLAMGLETIAFQNRYQCKDGSYKILSWNARADVGLRLIYGAARDVTRSREIEEALRLSEERFRSISDDVLDQATLGMVILDSDFRVVWANQTIGIFFGVARAELLGVSQPLAVDDWIKNIFADPEEFAAKVRAAYANNTYPESFECEVVAGTARGHRWLQHSSQPIESGLYRGGRIEFYTDISYLKQAESAVRTAMSEADRANRAKSEFLSRMSHELRTPLNAILGFGGLLETEGRTSDDTESISQIVTAGRHLLMLINEVLDISGIEAGRVTLLIEPTHLGDLVQEALSLVRPAAAARDMVLPQFHCERYVLADAQRLRQVVLNLLTNAIKYNVVGGQVVLSVEEPRRGMLRLKFHDTGAGISPEDLPKIFKPFERLGATKADTEGIGLGLAISRRLIKMMGGAIGAESVAGEGTTVWFDLPVAEMSPEKISDAESPPIKNQKSRIENAVTLLYIEDNPSNLRLIERIIARQPGMKLITATRGEIGLASARTDQPDLILLDLHLPDINGDNVLGQLRADPRTANIPVMMISADATPRQIERLKAAGAQEYLTKPLDVPSFLKAVEKLAGANGPGASRDTGSASRAAK